MKKRQLQQPPLPIVCFPLLITVTIGTKGILVFPIFMYNNTLKKKTTTTKLH